MTPQTLTTAADYNNAPVGTVVIDEDGCAWQKTTESTNILDGYTGSWQRAADDEVLDGLAMSEGQPSTVVYTPPQTDPAEPRKPSQREYTTQTDLTELSDAPIGTIAKDKGEDLWVKARYGWTLRGGYIKLPEKYAPYTVVHTPPSDPANL